MKEKDWVLMQGDKEIYWAETEEDMWGWIAVNLPNTVFFEDKELET